MALKHHPYGEDPLKVLEKLVPLMQQVLTAPNGPSALMTGAERLEQQGIAQGSLAILLKLLKLKFGPLAPEVIERAQSGSIEELELWAERILSAQTLDEVLG